MSWKGRHSRDWVKIGMWGDEYEVLHEEKSNTYGIFGVVQVGYDEEWMVFWRPNRNCTTDWKIKVMSEKIEVSYSNYPREEEVKYPTEEAAIASIDYLWQQDFVHPEKLKRYRPRDSQKTKLYRWEHVMARKIGPTTPDGGIDVLHHIHPHMHIRMFLNSVCDALGEKNVELKFRSGGSCSTGGQYTGIQLLPCHCNHLVLLHELSHVLHGRWGNKTDGNKHQAHGQEFVGIFMYFLIRFGGVDKSEIIRHANEHKIDFLLPTKFWEWEDSETQEKAA